MLTKSIPHYLRVFPLGLLLCLLVGAMPALGQQPAEPRDDIIDEIKPLVERGLRFSAFVGTCFKSGAVKDSCPLAMVEIAWTGNYDNAQSGLLRFNPGVHQRSFLPIDPPYEGGNTGPNVKGIGILGSDDWLPDPPPPPFLQAQPEYSAKRTDDSTFAVQTPSSHHGGTIIGLLEFGLPIPVEPKYLVEPTIGFGYGYVFEGKAKAPNRFAIAQQGMPAVSLGFGLSTRLYDKLDLIFQYRTIILFTRELEYIDAEGIRYQYDYATVTTSTVLVGIGFRLPVSSKKR